MIYFDYNATTPLDPEVRRAMEPGFESGWGNPSSVHQVGRSAKALLDLSRYRLAKAWSCKPSEVVFTSGGTEGNNLAIFGTARKLRSRGRHLITSPTEHHAVLQAMQFLERAEGFEVTYLPVDAWGRVSVKAVEAAIRPDTILVSVMAANNETGVLQPVAEIGALCRSRQIPFHTDAVQVFGKRPFTAMSDFEADLITVCAHKFHGPKGAGALYIRSPLQPESTQWGGAQENERRGGTENLAAILGLVSAFERFALKPMFPVELLSQWTEELASTVSRLRRVQVHSPSAEERLCNTIAFTVEGTDSMTLMANLDLEGLCASSGSACAAGSLEPSHVMLAMGLPANRANALVRLSLGRETTAEEVAKAKAILQRVIERL